MTPVTFVGEPNYELVEQALCRFAVAVAKAERKEGEEKDVESYTSQQGTESHTSS